MAQQTFPHACVAADHALASSIGASVLREGGNAVDAAVATSFALSVCRPYSCGIGGGGFMVIAMPPGARTRSGTLREHLRTTIDYRETAPRALARTSFEANPDPDAPTHGGAAVGVPGHVAGMLHALDRFGTMSLQRVIQPAIDLARRGFAADHHYAKNSQEVIEWLSGTPVDAIPPGHPARRRRVDRFDYTWHRYLHAGAVAPGTPINNHEQARVLELVRDRGRAGFYEGPVARAIVDSVRADGGVLDLADLAGFVPVERAPLVGRCAGMVSLSMAPPSSGGIVLAQVLTMLEHRGDLLSRAKAAGHNSPEYLHLVCEAMKHAFADRARWLGDTDFVDVPLDKLMSAARIAHAADTIRADGVVRAADAGVLPPPDDHGTSHLCVVDEAGGAVACTETINLIFGSLLVPTDDAGPLGFCLNNTLDDFVTRPGVPNAFGLSHARRNAPDPGKRPLSSMTPTILLSRDGERPAVLAGASGGPRIISATIQAILNMVAFDMDAVAAVAAPRAHHQWDPDTLQLEDALFTSPVAEQLRSLGHTVTRREPIGNAQVIRAAALADASGGWLPASDPRKGGAPDGH
jgi:gamma-glutamyltranspeptidase/glutathione hydrolase